jgi:thymidylate synthase
MLSQNNIFKSVNEAFVGMGNNLLFHGDHVSPRGFKTMELHPAFFTITNPSDCIIRHRLRAANYNFMIMEALWIISGDEEPWIIDYLKTMDRFTNIVDGKKYLMGAYGPRIRHKFGVDQLKYVIDVLKKDSNSRQATIAIIDPSVDTKGYNDVACTQWMHFMIRDGKLDISVCMRSNDWFLGFTYDSFFFCLLLHIVASMLGVPVGNYYHFANSFHVYEKHFKALVDITKTPDDLISMPFPSLLDHPINCHDLKVLYNDVSHARNLKTNHVLPAYRNSYIYKLLEYVDSTLVNKAVK